MYLNRLKQENTSGVQQFVESFKKHPSHVQLPVTMKPLPCTLKQKKCTKICPIQPVQAKTNSGLLEQENVIP